MVQEWGVENISVAIGDTNVRIAEILAKHGFETVDVATRGAHIQSARIENTDTRGIAAALAEQSVFVSQRGDWLRIAPHLYNDAADLDKLDQSLGLAMAE